MQMNLLLRKKFMTVLITFVLLFSSCSFIFGTTETGTVRTYDFTDSVNNKAYEGDSWLLPPLALEIGTELTRESYLNISRLDGNLAAYGATFSEYQRFDFKILERPASIFQIYVEHDGRGEGQVPGVRLFVWNNASYWDFVSEHSHMSENGVANGTISTNIANHIDANGYLHLLAQAKGEIASCPFLFSYNGEEYVFVADLYNRGILAVPGFRPQPEDYVKIDADQLRADGGFYGIQIAQEYDEISYLDKIALITVDHSPGFQIFPSLLKADVGRVYTVGRVLSSPVLATDENGKDVLQRILREDGIYTSGALNELKILDLNLGDLSAAKQVKLVISAYTNWNNEVVPKNDEQENRIGRSIQVKDQNGDWATVFKDFEVIAPAGLPRTYVLDMTGRFLTNDYSVRIGYYPDIRFDYIGIDMSAQQETVITTLSPIYADLHFRGYSELNGFPSIPDYYQVTENAPQGYSYPTGNFTKFGDVLPLLTGRDDKFVILRHGDEISLSFQHLPAAEGMERDFFLYSWGYYKGRGYATGSTVEPLPFHDMSSYPYPHNESYPSDSDHLAYLKQYNTREYTHEGSISASSDHHTIYTDYVKVDVWAVEPSTTSVTETSISHVVETSTTHVGASYDLATMSPYLTVVGLAIIILVLFSVKKIRKTQTIRG